MTELVSSLPSWWMDALKAAFIPTAIWWLSWKSRSAHAARARIWSAVFGRPKGDDPVIRNWLDERTSLMQLRAVTGVHFRTNAAAHRLREWSLQNDEEIGDVLRCKGFFDLEKPGIRGNGAQRWEVAVSFVAFAIAAALAMSFGAAMLSPRAWVSVRGSDATQLLLGAQDVVVWSTGQRIGPHECASPPSAVLTPEGSRPTVAERKAICRWFEDPDFPQKVHQQLTQQRGLLLGGGALCAFYWWLSYGWFSAATQTRYMMKRLAISNGREIVQGAEIPQQVPPSSRKRRRRRRKESEEFDAHVG